MIPDIEIELKYRIADQETAADLLASTAVGSFALEPFDIHRHIDTYLDTPQMAFAGAGYAFRFRQTEGETGVQIKSLTPAEGDLHRRIELSVITETPG